MLIPQTHHAVVDGVVRVLGDSNEHALELPLKVHVEPEERDLSEWAVSRRASRLESERVSE